VEILAVVAMIAAGGAVAVFGLIAYTIARGERQRANERAATRDEIAASILYQLLVAGGSASQEALRIVRREAGLGGQVTTPIDLASWGEWYARSSSAGQRMNLLETAVRLLSSAGRPLPLLQYSALLDLSFALGFHSDALARLREQYGFEYIDHAKNARPREADRAGGAVSLFAREPGDPREWLRVLEIETSSPTRQVIIAAYRRLVAKHHPDKISDRSEAAQEAAAARFIEITRAYERLLGHYRD
jgi:DnaJ-domain-containing protein 1